MRTVALNVASWTQELTSEDRAVFLSDRNTGESLTPQGSPVNSRDACCYVFSSMDDATEFSREVVSAHTAMHAEVYDVRGLGCGPLASFEHPQIEARARRVDHWRPVLGVLLWIIGIGFAAIDVRNDFSKLWPMLIGIKCCVLGTVCLVTFAARRFSRA